jgi:adenine-specific DNA-methyltransferase
MNYIGSKHSLLPFIDECVERVTGGDYETVCDIFAGTGAVGRFFKKRGKRVIANDIQYYSYALNRHYIGNNWEPPFRGLGLDKTANIVIKSLNELPSISGFIHENYCTNGRQYFTPENGQKCDAIRTQIEKWWVQKKITEDEYFFLLASLLESIDRVANTASVYGAFLKHVKGSAAKPLKLVGAEVVHSAVKNHAVYNLDANDLIKRIECDVLYLDPPYNHRQYCGNYHVLETIAKYDFPDLAGKTGMRADEGKASKYCSRVNVKNAFADLIKNAKAKYIFLSYNNEGLLTPDDIREIMSVRGEYGVFKKEYPRFRADKGEVRNFAADRTVEYLHYVTVGSPAGV